MKKRKKRRSKIEGGDKLPFDIEMGKNQKAIKVLQRLFDAGYGTEKEIVNMTMDEMLALPGVNVADLCIISELQKSIKANKVIAICQRKQKQGKKRKEQIMVEQPKYLEMTLSQLKAYVEFSESNVLLVVEFQKEIRTMENELEVVNIRLVREPSLYSEQILDSPQAVVELMAKELSQYDREVFCILNMKNNGQVINMNLVSVGTINASLVIPREVFKSSILANASAIIGLHNHPSGNVKPSKEDMIVTRKLQKCGQLLGIELLDHIIVGGTNGKMLSFREEKMLNVTGRMGEMER